VSFITVGCIFAMFIIAANKPSNVQISWLITFLVTQAQELFINPVALFFLQIFLIKLKKKTRKSKK
jgi:hypothetical protein